ncbi:MAG: hypothetical protein Q8J97_13120 [Flavobacteriaceae bacterium]|nr:hypothetical protein [Flavobacteriaceae bacterium]
MARKIIALNNEVLKAKEKLAEIERIRLEAENEEALKMEVSGKQIDEIAAENGMFVGVILTKADIVAIIDMALKSGGENVKIPYRLYFNE